MFYRCICTSRATNTPTERSRLEWYGKPTNVPFSEPVPDVPPDDPPTNTPPSVRTPTSCTRRAGTTTHRTTPLRWRHRHRRTRFHLWAEPERGAGLPTRRRRRTRVSSTLRRRRCSVSLRPSIRPLVKFLLCRDWTLNLPTTTINTNTCNNSNNTRCPNTRPCAALNPQRSPIGRWIRFLGEPRMCDLLV